MKTFIFYGFSVLCAVFLALFIINNQEKPSAKLLSVETTYTFLYEENGTIYISLYINDLKHPLLYKDLHQDAYIHNEDDSKRLSLTIKDIQIKGKDSYLNEVYHEVIFSFLFPYVGSNYEINSSYISFSLDDGSEFTFFIGDIYLSYQANEVNYLSWNELYASKKEDGYLSRIYEIYLPYQDLNYEIESISIGTDDQVNYVLEDYQVKITIEDDAKLLYDVPIIICYQDDMYQTVPTFRYIIDYQILKESGLLIHAYALD